MVAFAKEANSRRLRELLESSLGVTCLLCRSGGEVRRLAVQQQVRLVITGWMLLDGSAEELALDLPPACPHLLIGRQGPFGTCRDGVFCLPSPLSKRDLIATVRMLLEDAPAPVPSRTRGVQEQAQIEAAKRLLMERNRMTEAQAHRFLQKRSMDTCSSMSATAQRILDSERMI